MKTPTTNELMEAERHFRRVAANHKSARKQWKAGSPVHAALECSVRRFTVAADCIHKQLKRRIADRKRRAKR